MSEGARRRVSYAQLETLCDFLDQHKDIATGYNKSARARDHSKKMWLRISEVLNAHGDGAIKDWKSWSKYWNDYKSKLKRHVSSNHRAQQRTGGGPSEVTPLSEIEKRFLQILGNSFGSGLPGVRVEPFNQVLEQEDSMENLVGGVILDNFSTNESSPWLSQSPSLLRILPAFDPAPAPAPAPAPLVHEPPQPVPPPRSARSPRHRLPAPPTTPIRSPPQRAPMTPTPPRRSTPQRAPMTPTPPRRSTPQRAPITPTPPRRNTPQRVPITPTTPRRSPRNRAPAARRQLAEPIEHTEPNRRRRLREPHMSQEVARRTLINIAKDRVRQHQLQNEVLQQMVAEIKDLNQLLRTRLPEPALQETPNLNLS